jgi:lipid-binding SYLF domain-containing protein
VNSTELGLIITPLTFLPGLGMLISSTSNRYVELIHQMQRIFESERKYSETFMKSQRQRIILFKWVLTLLYLSVGFIFLGSIGSGLTLSDQSTSSLILYVFVILAGLSGLAAVFLLIRESFVSSSLILEQWTDKEKE